MRRAARRRCAIGALLFGLAAAPLAAQELTNEVSANRAALGSGQVNLLVATQRVGPVARQVRSALRRLGQIRFEAAELGYFRVAIPVAAVEQVARLPGVARIRVDGPAEFGQLARLVGPPSAATPPHLRPGLASPARTPLDLAALGVDSPAFGGAAIGLPELRRLHPSFDGRGVGIAVVEGIGDLAHPALQRARGLDGRPLAKLSGIVAATGCGPEALAPFADTCPVYAFPPQRVVADSAGRVRIGDRDVIAPGPGSYLATQVRLDDAGTAPLTMLWRPGERQVRLARHGTADFRGAALRLYEETGEVMPLGDDLSVILLRDRATGLPVPYPTAARHATSVAGVAAGGDYGGGAAGASAPAARLIYVAQESSFSRTTAAVLESMILAARRPDVDLLNVSLGVDDLESAQGFSGLIAERIMAVTGKPVFTAAGNTLGISETIDGMGNTPGVPSVGAYHSAASARLYAGLDLPRADYVTNYSRGPSRLGLMKPDFLAPSPVIAPTALSAGSDYHPVARWSLPRGYSLFGGTSAAAPSAASAAALLISGARQRGLPADWPRLFWALRTSARFLPDWPAHAQGAGLIQLPAAWALLERSAALPAWRYAPAIEAIGPVVTGFTQATGGSLMGGGLYEREGWAAGMTGERVLSIVRHAGPRAAVRYRIGWLGNDGTFTAAGELDLPRGIAVPLRLRIAPRAAGIHSANLVLIDSSHGQAVAWISTVVVAADRLEAANHYQVERSGTRGPLDVTPYFVDIPRGTAALRVDALAQSGDFNLDEMPQLSVNVRTLPNGSYAPFWMMTDFGAREAATRLYPAPSAGVWEFTVDTVRGAAHALERPLAGSLDNRHRLRFTALGADLVEHALSAGGEGRLRLDYRWRNRLGPIDLARVAVLPGVERTDQVTQTGRAAREIIVPTGTAVLRIAAEATDGRQLRLYLYRPERGAEPRLWQIPYEAAGTILVRNPVAGPWRLIARTAGDAGWDGHYLLRSATFGPAFGQGDTATPRTMDDAQGWAGQAEIRFDVAALPSGSRPALLVELTDEGANRAEQESLAVPVAFQRPVAAGSAVLTVPPACLLTRTSCAGDPVEMAATFARGRAR